MKRILGAAAAFGLAALIAGCGGSGGSNNGGGITAKYVPAGSYVGSIVGVNSGNQTMDLLRVNIDSFGVVSGQLLPLLNGAGATAVNLTGTLVGSTLTLALPSGTEAGVVVINTTDSSISGPISDTGVNQTHVSMSKSSGSTNLAGTHTGTLSVADGSSLTPTITLEANGNGGMTYTGGGGEAFVDENNRLYMDYEPTAGGTGHVLVCNLTATNSGVVVSNSLLYTPGQNSAFGVTGTLN